MILKHPKHKKIQEKVNGGDNTWDSRQILPLLRPKSRNNFTRYYLKPYVKRGKNSNRALFAW